MSKLRVVKAHQASYADPIKVLQGEPVALAHKTDIWDGFTWVWSKDVRGKSCWVPDTLVSNGVATRDYHAMELTCDEGDILVQHHVTHGWAWCRDASGNEGWVPQRNLEPVKTKNPAS
ncbi:MAG: SH3 domain-containing protein [Litoreibacter sp.]|nr:SH3 domain-containing protein [Litoreibacter sp.]MCY4335150.1 SH3 domain-containing protein [Litoreibacter sp.]